jgi:ankyrin repeat protein
MIPPKIRRTIGILISATAVLLGSLTSWQILRARALGQPLCEAAYAGDLNRLHLFLAEGADPNSNGSVGEACNCSDNPSPAPAIVHAVFQNQIEAANTLIRHGARVNVRSADGQTALMWARSLEMARLLVDHGAKLETKDRHGYTALVRCLNPDIAEFLVARGADVNARSFDGDTPLYTAVTICDADLVAVLVKRGARVNVADSTGETPLSLATREGRDDIARILIAVGAHPSG